MSSYFFLFSLTIFNSISIWQIMYGYSIHLFPVHKLFNMSSHATGTIVKDKKN